MLNRASIVLGTAGLFAALVSMTLVGQAQPRPATQKWEYQSVALDWNAEGGGLNKYGDEGWELVSVAPLAASHVAYLKRSK